MDDSSLALLIPILALCIPFFAIWTKHKRRLAEMEMMAGSGAGAQQSAEAVRRVQALEERVKVLERIVTDSSGMRGATLAQEIDALRDPSPARHEAFQPERAGTA